mmetsp:Transcript_12211/g.32885  ORF Transcript_12211/g.32885 Transcript_12211/m.32885 type:complete len:551 (+) Transcript_12211:55-1707(+)
MARMAEHEAAERQIRELLREEANGFCADCSAKNPMELNLTFGTIVCQDCATEHRAAKRRVKSVETASFMYDDADILAAVGNARANSHWLANWNPRDFPEPKPGDSAARREFLWLKYDGSWTRPGSKNPVDEPREGQGPHGYDTVRGAPPPPRGGYDAYETYRAPPPPRQAAAPSARYDSGSSSDSNRGKSKSKKAGKKSSKKKHSSSSSSTKKSSADTPTISVNGSAWRVPKAEDIPVADQLRLMFGEASVIQTPMGWRVMTPTHGLVFPQVAFNMGFAKMTQPQAVQVLQQRIVAQRQQALMAQVQLQREAAARQQQAEALQAQAKMIRKGGPAALNMVRMQQMQQQQQRNAMMAGMTGMAGGQYPVQQLEFGNGYAQQQQQLQTGMGMHPQQGYAQRMHMQHQYSQMQHPQVQMPPQSQTPSASGPLALPAPPQAPRSLARSGSHAGDSVSGKGGDILGGMAGGIDPQELLQPMNGAGISSEVNLYADLGAPAPPPPPPAAAAPVGAFSMGGGATDNPFAEFEGLGNNGQTNAGEEAFVLPPADNPFG